MFIINAATKVGSKILIPYGFQYPSLYIAFLFGLCTLASIPFYWFVEKPINNFFTIRAFAKLRPSQKSVLVDG
ncbi:hypothetical protein GCM10027299_47200 [Larkinella ripae]